MVDNSAHDSICGCSHDAVVAQVIGRYAEAEQIGSGLVGGRPDRDRCRDARRRLGRRQPVADRSPRRRRARRGGPAGLAVGRRSGSATDRCRRRSSSRGRPPSGVQRAAARTVEAFFRRRRHGRELFGRYDQRHPFDATADPAADRRPASTDVADPPELDIEELLAASRPPAGRRRTTCGTSRRGRRAPARPRARAGSRPRLRRGRRVDGGHARHRTPSPIRSQSRVERRWPTASSRSSSRDDGTFRLDRWRRRRSTGRPDRRRRGRRRQLQLRATRRGPARRAAGVGRRRGDRAAGPLRGELDDRRGALPGRAASTADATARTPNDGPDRVTTTLELRADEPFVRVADRLRQRLARPPRPLARPAARAGRPARTPRASSRSCDRGLERRGRARRGAAPDVPGRRLRPASRAAASCSTR